jgi:hypothetical protein
MDNLNAAERKLLAVLTADKNATADLEGIRGKVLLYILRTVGIEVTPAWQRMASSLGWTHTGPQPSPDVTDYEGAILDRQGSEYGETDVY